MKNFPYEQRAVDLLVPHDQEERTHGVEVAEGARERDGAGGCSFHTLLGEGQESTMASISQGRGAVLIEHSTQVRVIK